MINELEQLEPRALLSAPPQVSSVVADNRGEVLISLNRSVKSATITRSSVLVFSGGPDGFVGNGDDMKLSESVTWNGDAKRITIRARGLAPGEGYRIKLNSSQIYNKDGVHLDGEFTGKFHSGDGVAGGNFELQTKNDRSIAPLVRVSTQHHGPITIKMFRDAAPISVANFFNYANSGRYDNLFITRAIPGFIIQAGSLQLNSSNHVVAPAADGPIKNEFDVSNTRGTIAFAKVGPAAGQPPTNQTINSATNQFFFNLGDNSSNLDNQNGGFTVFGRIVGAAGLDAMDQIVGDHDIVALHNPLNNQGVLPAFSGTSLTNVPIEDKDQTSGSVQNLDNGDPVHNVPPTQAYVVTGNFDAPEQLVLIRRVAVLMKVAPLG